MGTKKEMSGYVINAASTGIHIMKRYVAPNGKIELEELYKQYGDKYNLNRGKSFIKWLSDVKLRDKSRWQIKEDPTNEEVKTMKEEQSAQEPKLPSHMSVMDIVELSVRKAREAVPSISDIKTLKYAYKEASQRTNKQEVCKILKKRIDELATLGMS